MLTPSYNLPPSGELIAETTSAPLGTRYLKVSDYFTPDETTSGPGLGPGSGLGGITGGGGGASHGSGAGARAGGSIGTGASVAQQAAAAVYRPHAVCTVQTFRNAQTGPMLYLFVSYYHRLGWRVIVYDRFGFHREFIEDLLPLPGFDYYNYTIFQQVTTPFHLLINPSSQHTLSTHPLNTPHQHTLSTGQSIQIQ